MTYRLGKRPRKLRWHIEILIFLLPQPSQRGGKENPIAPLIGTIRTRTMKRTTHPQKDRSGRHLGSDHLVVSRDPALRPSMTPGNQMRAAISFGEIGYRPHASDDHIRTRHFEKLEAVF